MDKEYKKPSKNQKKSSMYDLMNRNNLRNVHVRRRGNTDLLIEYHFLMLYLKTDTNPHTGVTSVLIQKRRITLSGLWL